MTCEFCKLDRVELVNVPRCVLLSVSGLLTDFTDGNTSVVDALRKDDRILYLVGILIIALAARLLFLY